MSAKKIAKKRAKHAAKKRAKRGPARKRRLPREEDVPGYSPGLPDMEKWPDIAIAYKVRPFYNGKNSVPFSRLRAPGSRFYRHPASDEKFVLSRTSGPVDSAPHEARLKNPRMDRPVWRKAF
jgi:hypothetical protein